MINLYDETMSAIKNAKKTSEEIFWLGVPDCRFNIESFFEVAARTNYDNGYGGAEIPEDFKIVFADGSWLERAEYDGSEWWEYKKTPKMPINVSLLNKIQYGIDKTTKP